MRGFIDDLHIPESLYREREGLNPRSCAASSMTAARLIVKKSAGESQSAFVRGFIDDEGFDVPKYVSAESQSAFVRGFIDDFEESHLDDFLAVSQSAFVRGFIDDSRGGPDNGQTRCGVSIRVRARLHR